MENTARAWLFLLNTDCPTCTTSLKPTAMASEVFLVMFRYWLPSGGMMMRNACGRITLRSDCEGLKPRAMAASVWPLATASTPPRTISAMKLAVYSTRPTNRAAKNTVIVSPVSPKFTNRPELVVGNMASIGRLPRPLPNLSPTTPKKSLPELMIQLDRPGQTTHSTAMAAKAEKPAKTMRK